VYMAIRFGPMKTPGAYASYPGGTLGGTLLGMPAVWAHYLRLLVWPWPLCADYTGYFAFGRVGLAHVVLPALVVMAYLAALVLALRRRQTVIALGLGWFALALGPVSNFMPVPIPAAERFLYQPLVGIALAAAALFGLAFEAAPPARRRALLLAGVAWLGAQAVLINLRHAIWTDDATLWAETVRVNPRACGAQSAVGGTLLGKGMVSGSRAQLRAAAARQELALRLCPDASDQSRAAIIYTRLGAARALLGELPSAHAALERAMELSPRYALPVVWLGYVHHLEGHPDEAARLLKYAIIDLGPPSSGVAEVAQRYVDKI
jgi:tetratricopeptide (TPR) repeat protein